jgi:hypothetical protein
MPGVPGLTLLLYFGLQDQQGQTPMYTFDWLKLRLVIVYVYVNINIIITTSILDLRCFFIHFGLQVCTWYVDQQVQP